MEFSYLDKKENPRYLPRREFTLKHFILKNHSEIDRDILAYFNQLVSRITKYSNYKISFFQMIRFSRMCLTLDEDRFANAHFPLSLPNDFAIFYLRI